MIEKFTLQPPPLHSPPERSLSHLDGSMGPFQLQ
jgi:hypothetical protein